MAAPQVQLGDAVVVMGLQVPLENTLAVVIMGLQVQVEDTAEL